MGFTQGLNSQENAGIGGSEPELIGTKSAEDTNKK